MREIATQRYADLTSPKLRPQREKIIAAKRETAGKRSRLSDVVEQAMRADKHLARADKWGWRWFIDKDKAEEKCRDLMFQRSSLEERLSELEAEQAASYGLDTEEAREWHRRLRPYFLAMASASHVWDVTHDRGATYYKSSAAETIRRERVKLSESHVSSLDTDLTSFRFGNSNGPELHILPGLLVVEGPSKHEHLALIAFTDVTIDVSLTRFVEAEAVPADATVVDHAWRYQNKDGGPDRRFNDNYQIPVALYGALTIRSTTGVHEHYMVSDANTVVEFAKATQRIQSELATAFSE